MRFTFTILLVIGMAFSYASNKPPAGCKPLRLQSDSISLTKKKPSLILIHNLASTELWLTHPVTQPSASAGWNSRLGEKHWSALALNKKTFKLGCIESKPGHEQQTSCSSVIFLCQWPMKLPNSTTFWAAEDMSLKKLLNYLEEQDFKLPVKK